MYMRSTMDEQRLTGLVLMNVHSDMSLDTEEIIKTFAIKQLRRIKFRHILEDIEYTVYVIVY